VDRLERIGLHVHFQEGDVLKASGLGVLAAVLQKPITTVNSKHRAGRPDQARKLDRSIAKAAAGIDDRVTLSHLKRGKDLCAVQRQSSNKDVTPSNELGNEHIVPEIDVLAPRCDVGAAHVKTCIRLNACLCLRNEICFVSTRS
jgi:hypothetical protein